MKDKVATFHVSARNHVYSYMSLGTIYGCHFTWIGSVPIHADESRSIGAFYALPNKYQKKRGYAGGLQKRILALREDWLKKGGET